MAEMKAESAMRDLFCRTGEGRISGHGVPQEKDVNVSFGQQLHASGRNYPVWQSIVDWRQCHSQLTLPAQWTGFKGPASRSGGRSRIILSLTEMFDKDFFWIRQATDIQHLPLHIAKFLRDLQSIVTPTDILPAEEDKLTWHHVQALCGMVQPYPVRNNKDSAAKHHLLVHQAISIQRPGGDRQVMPTT
jgi:hypothetical protein